MTMTHLKRLSDKYRSLFLGVLLFCFHSAVAQTYNPSTCCTVSNKAYGAAQAVSTDGRSWFYDATNFVMRDYNGTTEVLSYLNLPKYRSGHFPCFVHFGGVLGSNGVWVGGSTLVYWFKDSTGDANLVRWYTDSTGLPGGPFYAVANNLSEGNAGLIKGNLALDLVNNTSDATKNAASVSLTNHTIDANNNTLLHIPNAALTNNSIGLTVTPNSASDIVVTTTPAALGANLIVNIPSSGTSSRGALTASNWNFFNGKMDSVHVSNDSIYNCVNGTCTLQSVIAGGGAVNSVNGTNTSLLFSPTTGNVLGQVNPAYSFNWSGQHSFLSFAPIFSTLTTNGGLFYGSGTGQLLQTAAGTTAQILQSNGGSAPTFFTPNAATVDGWLGYTPLSSALASTHIFVGNGSNLATDVAVSGDIGLSNTGVATIQPNAVTNSKAAQMAANTIKGNNTGSPANPIDLTIAQVATMLSIPQTFAQVLATGRTLNQDSILLNAAKALHIKGGILNNDTLNSYVSTTVNTALIATYTGTSVTLGTGASISAKDYVSIVSGGLNVTQDNQGDGGYTLSNPPGTSAPSWINTGLGQNYLNQIPTKTAGRKYLFFEWGENDSWYAFQYYPFLDYSTARFIAAYHQVIDTAKGRGWDSTNMIIISPVWQLTTRTSLLFQDSIFNAAQLVAATYHFKFIDVYHSQQFTAAADKADDVHPSDYGHSKMGELVLQSMDTLNVVGYNGQNVAINGVLEAKQMVLRNVDTATLNAQLMGLNPGGRLATFPQDKFVQYYKDTSLHQTGNIGTTGGINAGATISTGGYFRAGDNGNVGGGVFLYGGTQIGRGFIEAYNNVTGIPTDINPNGDITGISGRSGVGAHIGGALSQLYGGAYVDKFLNLDSGNVGSATPYQIVTNGTHIYWKDKTGLNTYQLDQQVSSSPLIKYQHTIFIPTTGGTVNLVNGQYNIINPAGALLAVTLNLPSSPANNDVVYIKFTQTISTVTYANGTVVDGITAPTAGGLVVLTYDGGTTSWY